LSARLALLARTCYLEAMDQIAAGEIRREKQNDAQASLARILNKEDGQVDWSRPAGEIYNRMRGFAPWPGAYTMFRGQQLTIFQARPVEGNLPPGNLQTEKRRVLVGCGGNTALELLEIQLAGKKRMTAGSIVERLQIERNEQLGVQREASLGYRYAAMYAASARRKKTMWH